MEFLMLAETEQPNSHAISWDGHLYHMHIGGEERRLMYITLSHVF